MLWYYAKGKPKESLELAGAQELRVRWMSDADLVAETMELIEKARST